MHWLAELFGELLALFMPSNSSHVNRSKVGESRFDREARWIAIAFLVISVALIGGCLYLRR
jgi:hypothetical protein